MVNANELRIGSTYKWGENIITLSQKDLRDILELDDIENIYPIEPTEDILIRCGFEATTITFDSGQTSLIRLHKLIDEHTSLFVFKNNMVLEQRPNERAYPLSNVKCTTLKKQQYLHQLQNFYYALTGEELNIELNAPVSDTSKV